MQIKQLTFGDVQPDLNNQAKTPKEIDVAKILTRSAQKTIGWHKFSFDSEWHYYEGKSRSVCNRRISRSEKIQPPPTLARLCQKCLDQIAKNNKNAEKAEKSVNVTENAAVLPSGSALNASKKERRPKRPARRSAKQKAVKC